METGTQNHEGIIGTAAAIDFLAGLSEEGTRRERITSTMRELHTRGTALVRRLWDGLRAIRGVTCYGPPPGRPRTPTVVFTVAAVTPDNVAGALADRGIFASHGDFYATSVIERLGCAQDGVVRAGCACYTTLGEVDALLGAVEEIAR
jgi:selenocysteine lyase/cysteine desulfurase